jgi:site-specific DNA recombinase
MRELLVNIELVYFVYVRKSTDVEDKQILSVAAQIIELKEFAKRMGLRIAGVIIEKQTAKKPGRPKFNKMLERIEAGEANGILAWLPDRLSRNSIDSGRVIYMLDENIIADLKFPHFWFENTPQGKYMLANEFNSSKQYVDNLSVNTKRGLRQKVREGHCPRLAPVGYINDVRTKTIWLDKRLAPIVRQAFELYATGTKTLEDIAAFLYANGIKTRGRRRVKGEPKSAGGRQWHASRVKRMLQDVFYYGHFRYVDTVHEGKHTPIIDKPLFDKVQRVLARRGRAQKRATAPQPLNLLVRCGSCDCFVTGAHKIKQQKNGNIHEYTYYRCTHKKKAAMCREKEVREYVLAGQLVPILQSFALPKDWRDYMASRLEQDRAELENESRAMIDMLRDELDAISAKLKRLFDVYLDGDVDREDYKDRQAELMSQKKSLEGKIERVLANAGHWIEPMQQWLETAVSICSIDDKSEHSEIAQAFHQIEGLNLKMKNKKVVAERDAKSHSPQKNSWLALRAAREKTAPEGGNFRSFPKMVRGRGLEPPRPKAATSPSS